MADSELVDAAPTIDAPPPASAPKVVPDAAPAPPPDRPHRLLVADDEHLVATGLCHNLSRLGFSIVGPAADGEQAVALCKRERPDLVLLDIRMPRLDGLAAAEVIHRQLGIPTIILSAFSDPQCVESASRVGVFGYLLKPVTQDQLRVCITIAWGRYLESADQHSQIDGLKQRLEDRKIIEQAKWIIVKRKGIEEPDAMKMLQRQARNTRRTLADVAQSVIENENLFNAG
jgi:response regulator NasT